MLEKKNRFHKMSQVKQDVLWAAESFSVFVIAFRVLASVPPGLGLGCTSPWLCGAGN